MATQSFYEMLEIDTPEKAERLVAAFRAAELRGPYVPKHDVERELEEGRKKIIEFFEKRRAEENRG